MSSLNPWCRRIFTELAGIFVAVVAFSGCSFAELKPETTAAFESCLKEMEASILQKQNSTQTFVLVDDPTQSDHQGIVSRLRSGDVLIKEGAHCSAQVPGGLVHHWIADAFIPGTTVQDVFKVLKNAAQFPRVYRPQVVTAQLLSDTGATRQVKLRLRKQSVVTVVLDGIYDVHDGQLDRSHVYSVSRSVEMRQIKNVGTASEYALPEGKDDGFLWRLNTYWRLEQSPSGVFAECETISLTRDIPWWASLFVKPFVTKIPRESLEFTLTSTRNAVLSLPKKP